MILPVMYDNLSIHEKRLCIDRDFSLSAMLTRESRIDTLNLHSTYFKEC